MICLNEGLPKDVDAIAAMVKETYQPVNRDPKLNSNK